MKKKFALLLALVIMLLSLSACGTTEGLKKVPQGERPENLDMDSLSPEFPSDNSLKNEMMTLASDLSAALSQERQETLYDRFLHEGYIYVVGPYNFVSYVTDSGTDMTAYYDNMVGHISTYLSDYEPAAWNALQGKDWSNALKEKYLAGKCTPYSIRNSYNLSDSDTQTLVQNMYTERSEYASALSDGFPDGNQGQLLSDLLSASNAVAEKSEYANFLEYYATEQSKLPYALSDIRKLCSLVKETLVPAVQSAAEASVPALSAETWNEKLPALAACFPEYADDLSCVLSGKAYKVEEGETSSHFGYMLYQYDFSAGKAIISGQKDDALQVFYGLGLAARNMALPESEWSISGLSFYDAVQERAFAAAAIFNSDVLFDNAQQSLVNCMAQDACKAAMELELLTAIYDKPELSQEERNALFASLRAEYGVEDYDFFAESDIYMGTMSCVGELLGDLYGLQLYALYQTDETAANAVLHDTLSVYNVGNPISNGYAAGLQNPFNGEGIERIAALIH